MAQTDLDKIELQYLDLWFANIVDAVNYNLGLIEIAVPALAEQLTTLDTAPIAYLKDSLDKFVVDINNSLSEIRDRLSALEGQRR